MTGANMNLVTVNVKLGESDPEPEQKLEPVCVFDKKVLDADEKGEHIVRRVVPVKDLHSILQGGSLSESLGWDMWADDRLRQEGVRD
jgi:ADP-ribose pyrophosphatase